MKDPTQNAHGSAHFTYYHEPSQLSFVWAGEYSQHIEVSYGGYGENVFDQISPSGQDVPLGDPRGAKEWLTWFQDVCDLYTDRFAQRLINATQELNDMGDGKGVAR